MAKLPIIDPGEIDDGRVLVLYRATGMARTSGVPLDTRTGQIWTAPEAVGLGE